MNEQYNPHIFENQELWENYDSTGEISAKLPLIMAKIPADVKSIIDVGCGNGDITNHFSEKIRVLGVDLSEEALKHVTKDKIRCSCDDISPVENRSFDMVFSSELIEHLPSGVLEKTFEEFRRIARKYIFISVPFREQLPYYYIKCPSCGSVFHAYGHLNSFTVDSLSRMVGPGFRLMWHTTTGKKVREYHPRLLKMRHKYAGTYFAPSRYTVCPGCQNREYPEHKGNVKSKLLNGLNLLIPYRKKKYWLMALYVKV